MEAHKLLDAYLTNKLKHAVKNHFRRQGDNDHSDSRMIRDHSRAQIHELIQCVKAARSIPDMMKDSYIAGMQEVITALVERL